LGFGNRARLSGPELADISPGPRLGGNVRKGEHGTTVIYADRFTPDDEKKRARETGEEAQTIPSSSASLSSTWRNAKVCRRISWSPHRRRNQG
jgi:hypothetical protein